MESVIVRDIHELPVGVPYTVLVSDIHELPIGVTHTFIVSDIHELPLGKPLEKKIHLPYKRAWQPESKPKVSTSASPVKKVKFEESASPKSKPKKSTSASPGKKVKFEGKSASPKSKPKVSTSASPVKKVKFEESASPKSKPKKSTSASPGKKVKFEGKSASPKSKPKVSTSASPIKKVKFEESASPKSKPKKSTSASPVKKVKFEGKSASPKLVSCTEEGSAQSKPTVSPKPRSIRTCKIRHEDHLGSETDFNDNDESMYINPTLRRSAWDTPIDDEVCDPAPTDLSTPAITEEFTPSANDEATPAITEEFTPSTNDEATPAITEEFTPSTNDEATPAITEEFTPSANDEATPAITVEFTPSTNDEATPAITEEFTPSANDEATPAITVEFTPSTNDEATPAITEEFTPTTTTPTVHEPSTCASAIHELRVGEPYTVIVRDIHKLPLGKPLEKPLHPPYKRAWQPESNWSSSASSLEKVKVERKLASPKSRTVPVSPTNANISNPSASARSPRKAKLEPIRIPVSLTSANTFILRDIKELPAGKPLEKCSFFIQKGACLPQFKPKVTSVSPLKKVKFAEFASPKSKPEVSTCASSVKKVKFEGKSASPKSKPKKSTSASPVKKVKFESKSASSKSKPKKSTSAKPVKKVKFESKSASSKSKPKKSTSASPVKKVKFEGKSASSKSKPKKSTSAKPVWKVNFKRKPASPKHVPVSPSSANTTKPKKSTSASPVKKVKFAESASTKFTNCDVSELPIGVPLETSVVLQRKRRVEVVACTEEGSAQSKPTVSPKPRSIRTRKIRHEDHLGSENDSNDSDNDESMYINPRLRRSAWDTPIDDDDDQSTTDEFTPAINDESTPATTDEFTPAVNDESTPATTNEFTPATNEKSTPATNDVSTPVTNDESTPATSDEFTSSINDASTPATTNEFTPPINDESTPATTNEFTPVTNDESTPATNDASTPETNNESTPATADEFTPAVNDESTPATTNDFTPATNDESTPATTDEFTPAINDESTPATTNEFTPATNDKSTPATNGVSTPVTNDASTPATTNEFTPATNDKSTPATNDVSTPLTNDESTPATAVEFTPATNDKSTPVTNDASTPATTDEFTPTTTDESKPAPTVHEPSTWLDFQWREFPIPSIPSSLRREAFSQSIAVGPIIPYAKPYDVFIAIWSPEFMEHIVHETNRYGKQAYMLHKKPFGRKWQDTTVDELYVYFGLIIAMEVVVKIRLEEYWSSTPNVFHTPGFSAHMSYNRFVSLNNCLHFSNNDMCVDMDISQAKLYKIQPILTHLNTRFQSLYTLSQNLAIGESLLTRKGLLDVKAATELKTNEICEAQTGYLWRFEVHTHNTSPQSQDSLDATADSVLRLISGLENKGYTIWMDNLYNSPCLARRLKSIGFDCVGRLQTTRKFVPEVLNSLTDADMRPGQITGFTSGDIDVMVCKDNKKDAFISTYHGNAVARVDNTTKPILICDYDSVMGEVANKDQLLAMYPMERNGTKIWYKKLFRRLLNVSVLNSYIIYRHNGSLDHRNFRIWLVNSLLSEHVKIPPPPPPPPVLRKQFDMSHRLEANSPVKGKKLYRTCIVCEKRVITFCAGCRIATCINNCFLELHTKPIYLKRGLKDK